MLKQQKQLFCMLNKQDYWTSVWKAAVLAKILQLTGKRQATKTKFCSEDNCIKLPAVMDYSD